MVNIERNKYIPNIISNSKKKDIEDVLRSLFSAKIPLSKKR